MKQLPEAPIKNEMRVLKGYPLYAWLQSIGLANRAGLTESYFYVLLHNNTSVIP